MWAGLADGMVYVRSLTHSVPMRIDIPDGHDPLQRVISDVGGVLSKVGGRESIILSVGVIPSISAASSKK